LSKLLDNCVSLLIVTASGDPLPVVPHGTGPRSAPSAIPCSALAVPSLGPGGALYTGLSHLFDTLPSPAAQVSNDPPL
jgi:hypothetical protein